MSELHTCHEQCPCRSGGVPAPDFLPREGQVQAALAYLTLKKLTAQPKEKP